ncbi:hypothetical protein T07_2056 [Trichinella nelsoni]|uniref:Uncharacterized protein n=1 Tax=Trichinella nelsoni TaxID=6336 RepID=A0A0V0RIS0_9BILA|nr:hypothetical protein T07_2946 [Trichinella nelsoni]KRX15874.1 hypothetical protein T07_2056 [Trichinella nelsoni]
MNSRFEFFTPGLLGRYPIARFIFIRNIPHFVDIWYELLIRKVVSLIKCFLQRNEKCIPSQSAQSQQSLREA